MAEQIDQSASTNEPEASGLWAWIVTGVVVVVAVFGFYAWPANNESGQPAVVPETEETVDAQAQALEQVSPSDDLEAIADDLDKTDFSNLDKEAANIEAEVSAEE